MISRIRQTFVFHADKVINILYNHCVIEGGARTLEISSPAAEKIENTILFPRFAHRSL